MELYTKGVKQAGADGELAIWKASFDENVRCAKKIEQDLKTKGTAWGVVAELVAEFSTERLLWVLSHTAKKFAVSCSDAMKKQIWSIDYQDSTQTTVEFEVNCEQYLIIDLFEKVMELAAQPA